MTRSAIVRQRDLFEADERQTAPIPVQREQLAGLIEALGFLRRPPTIDLAWRARKARLMPPPPS